MADWPPLDVPDLPAEVTRLLTQLPQGKVTTFGTLARALGDIAAAKWLALWLGQQSPEIQAHRVLRASGELAETRYRTADEQAALLRAEGIEVHDGSVDLNRYGWDACTGSAPLQELASRQEQIALQVETTPCVGPIHQVGAVDVAYPEEGLAQVALVIADALTAKIEQTLIRRVPASFPYISGYLAFREIPAILTVLDEADRAGLLPPLLLVDGNGILHPRGVGVATQLGVITGLSTIGVGKSQLCGTLDQAELEVGQTCGIRLNGQPVGRAFRPLQSRQLLYISPGHRVSVDQAAHLACSLMRGHRLPEPLYWADRFSKQPMETQAGGETA